MGAMSELAKAYEPKEVEAKWYAAWQEAGCFTADPASEKPGYSIVIPPPNVTGILHLGHVLNNALQDILARRARQLGHEVLWLPGTDHAGIATQTKVEQKIRLEENRTRRDLGREEFLKRVWEWKEKHGGIIIDQLKRLGCSCDWSRERFTMDEAYSREVQQVFVRLFEKGLIYRGLRMVNWCPASLTALSDEEVIPKEQQSKIYTMRYEVVEQPGRMIEIATTRPETLMGDTAVAVHPEDERYVDLIGLHVWRPFPRAAIPIIADAVVEKEFGTGALKVTPAHDRADFEIGQRHDLPIIDVMHPDGRINCADCPELDGLDRFKARKLAVAKLQEMGALVKEEEHANAVGYSERANVPIEPRLSLQWFLRYPSVERTAAAVANGDIVFRPERWKKTFAHWMENLQDWCISRQLWWGHRIPVWYRKDRAAELQAAETLDWGNLDRGDLHVGVQPPENPEDWVQDEDSMDTWFSSWLWPFATMDEATRSKFYPTNDLVTGPDIIFFWVARMIMAGYEFMDELPFRHVYFTSIIRDKKGLKMSKSLGNSPDPIELMEKYGADGLRYGLLRIAPVGSDVRFDESQIEEGRNFANKIYNACRLRQMSGGLDGAALSLQEWRDRGLLRPYHIDIMAKLDALALQLKESLGDYRFGEAAQKMHEFLWSEFCDCFLEAVKGDLRDAAPEQSARTLWVFDAVMSRFLQLLHPYMPHVTEELSQLMGYVAPGEFLMRQPLPPQGLLEDVNVDAEKAIAACVYEAGGRIRNLKAEYQVATRRDVTLVIKSSVSWLEQEKDVLALLAGAKVIRLEADYEAPKGTPVTITGLGEVYLPMEGLVDVAAERIRLSREVTKITQELERSVTKLSNASFVERAPAAVVEQEKLRQQEWRGKLQQLQDMLSALD